MNLAVWKKNLTLALDKRNLTVLGIAVLLLALLALGLLWPTFKKAERLAAAIPEEKILHEQTKGISAVASALQSRLETQRELARTRNLKPDGEEPDSPSALRRLAAERQVDVRELRLEIPERNVTAAHLKMEAELIGELASLQSLALAVAALPSFLGVERLELQRDGGLFELVMEMRVADE